MAAGKANGITRLKMGLSAKPNVNLNDGRDYVKRFKKNLVGGNLRKRSFGKQSRDPENHVRRVVNHRSEGGPFNTTKT